MAVIGTELCNGDRIAHVSIVPSNELSRANVGIITERGRVYGVLTGCRYVTDNFGDDEVHWELVPDMQAVIDCLNEEVRYELN